MVRSMIVFLVVVEAFKRGSIFARPNFPLSCSSECRLRNLKVTSPTNPLTYPKIKAVEAVYISTPLSKALVRRPLEPKWVRGFRNRRATREAGRCERCRLRATPLLLCTEADDDSRPLLPACAGYKLRSEKNALLSV